MRKTFTYIMREALERKNQSGRKDTRFYTYGELAAIDDARPTEPKDWKHDGWARNVMYGLEGRAWLVGEFRLWFKADETTHKGLVFTADCPTGLYWFEDDVADRVMSAAKSLLYLAREAERLQPTFRDYFRNVQTGGRRLSAGADKLNELRDPEYLRLLGIDDDQIGDGNGKAD